MNSIKSLTRDFTEKLAIDALVWVSQTAEEIAEQAARAAHYLLRVGDARVVAEAMTRPGTLNPWGFALNDVNQIVRVNFETGETEQIEDGVANSYLEEALRG